MRIKLSYKVFAAFLLTSLVSVMLMIAIIHYHASQNFANYINKVELGKLDRLISEVSKEYRKQGGWDTLKNNRSLWERILDTCDLKPRRHDQPRLKHPFPPPHHIADEEFLKPERALRHDMFPDENRENPERRPPPDMPPDDMPLPNDRNRDGNGLPRHEAVFGIGPRISLFDAQKQLVIGNPFISDQLLKEIRIDGKIVGRIGLKRRKPMANPLEIAFLRQQYELFYLTGGIIFILTALVSFFLSGHILKPVRKLAQGTLALASRKFETRICVRSSDELGELASNFNTMAQTLEKYEQMQKQWISDISHELRTPLSILRGELEAAQDGIRELNMETLDSLHDEAIHLSKIVEGLHQLSLADAESVSLKKEAVNPLSVLKKTLTLFQSRFAQQQILIQHDLDAGQNIMLSGDGDRLMQLFSNLLENTLRYTNSPGKLNISGRCEQNHILLSFEDSGPGVPEASLERLFDRLYRVDPSRSRAKGGSGLGLAICKNIVETHGGTIRALNAPGGGLRIEIMFPPAPRRL